MERSGTGGADVSAQMSKRQRGVATDRQASASAGGTQGRRRQEDSDQSHVEKHPGDRKSRETDRRET